MKALLALLLVLLIVGCSTEPYDGNAYIQSDLSADEGMATPTVDSDITHDSPIESGRIEAINANSNRENTLNLVTKIEELVYGYDFSVSIAYRDLIYINEAGEYLWNGKNCTLIYSQYYLENGGARVAFFLMDENEDIVYIFPEFSPTIIDGGSFLGVYDVSYQDIDADGFYDFIIISECARGHGEYPMAPVPTVVVYFGEDNGFRRDEDLEFDINYSLDMSEDEIYDMNKVVEFLKTRL